MDAPKIIKPFKGSFPISQKFGEANEWYVKVAGYPHNGIDFAMPDGTPILACDNGTISYADNVPDADGLGINLLHNWGISQYWHLSRLVATLGQNVKKGEIIGYSGHSGWATGAHLHFGVKVNPIENNSMHGWSDPALYIEPDTIAPAIIPPKNKTYLVLPGNTLWGISVKFYGTGLLWARIYEANKDTIKNPNVILPWKFINIP